MHVTIEQWTVFRAWLGDQVERWCIVHDGLPVGPNFETREEAAAQAAAWGWTVVEPADLEV